MQASASANSEPGAPTARPITLFLCGDVMLGRGIDQILPNPGDPRLHERLLGSATDYVGLAEAANGPIGWPVSFSYVWGDALEVFERVRPHARIVNLETSVTTHEDYAPKGINYRMNPANVACLKAAAIDCCVLANNHVLDWGRAGLAETLAVLKNAGIASAGAGETSAQAAAPAILPVAARTRVIVFAFGSRTSGIPAGWAATRGRAGINLLPDLSARTVDDIAQRVGAVKRPGDVVVASIHWGGNWGYRIAPTQREFAHALIECAAVDIVHGHSSHHAKAIEIYRGRTILYGCGDFLNDYEGIKGDEEFRDDIALMYFLAVDPADGHLLQLDITPLQIRKFRLHRASRQDAQWICRTLNRESGKFATRFAVAADNALRLVVP